MTLAEIEALGALQGQPLTPAQVAEITPLIADENARRDDLVAEVLSRTRTRIQPRRLNQMEFIGVYPGGPVEAAAILDAIRAYAQEEGPLKSVLGYTVAGLASDNGIEFGNTGMHALMQELVGPGKPLTAAQASVINGITRLGDPVSREAVSRALNVAQGRMVV